MISKEELQNMFNSFLRERFNEESSIEKIAKHPELVQQLINFQPIPLDKLEQVELYFSGWGYE